MDDSITSNVLKFADDTKLFRKVNTDSDKQHLQNDLDRLVKWSEKWQMLYNFGKCKCLHTGHGNLNVNYKMGDTVLKFADDTKLFRKVNTDGDKQHLQNDLDRLVKWSEKWQMLFNFGKCKCLHTGHGNLNVNYKMGDTVLGTTVKERAYELQ